MLTYNTIEVWNICVMSSRLLSVPLSIALIVFYSLTIQTPIYAQNKKVSLTGLKKICVVVESLNPVYRKTGVDRKLLTLKVRRKLNDAGFSISSKEEYRASGLKIPILSVSLETVSTDSDQLTNCISVRLIDMAVLNRVPGKTVTVTSWSAQKVANIPMSKPKKIVSHTLSVVDKFIDSWKQANHRNAR